MGDQANKLREIVKKVNNDNVLSTSIEMSIIEILGEIFRSVWYFLTRDKANESKVVI